MQDSEDAQPDIELEHQLGLSTWRRIHSQCEPNVGYGLKRCVEAPIVYHFLGIPEDAE